MDEVLIDAVVAATEFVFLKVTVKAAVIAAQVHSDTTAAEVVLCPVSGTTCGSITVQGTATVGTVAVPVGAELVLPTGNAEEVRALQQEWTFSTCEYGSSNKCRCGSRPATRARRR